MPMFNESEQKLLKEMKDQLLFDMMGTINFRIHFIRDENISVREWIQSFEKEFTEARRKILVGHNKKSSIKNSL